MERKPTSEEYVKAVLGVELEEVPPEEAKQIQEGTKKFLERISKKKQKQK